MRRTVTDTPEIITAMPPDMVSEQSSANPAVVADDTGQGALRRALTHPRYEIIPMKGACAQARALPAGATVTVTCSPGRGVAATIELAEQVQKLGYTTVPHLAAKRFHSRSHLDETMARLTAVGVRDVFVVGGDGDSPSGPFARGADLIAALAESRPDLRSVGIPCYPEGHGFIASEVLEEALDAKCFFAGHMVTQICFDAAAIDDWLTRVRARGIDLPVYIGIPGMIERRKLLGIALRIGLGDSTRFLKKNSGFMGRLAGPSRFTPDALIDDMTDMLADAQRRIAGFHINTFNQVESVETWRHNRLSMFAAPADDEARAVLASRGSGY